MEEVILDGEKRFLEESVVAEKKDINEKDKKEIHDEPQDKQYPEDIDGLFDLSSEEKIILDKIRMVLRQACYMFITNEYDPRYIVLNIIMDNKPFELRISLLNKKIRIEAVYPFHVQTNAIPIMCLYITEYNTGHAITRLNLNIDTGVLVMSNAYILEEPEQFNEKIFKNIMSLIIHEARNKYAKLMQLSVGLVASRKDRELYANLMQLAVGCLTGHHDENAAYGVGIFRYERSCIAELDVDEEAVDLSKDKEYIVRNYNDGKNINYLASKNDFPKLEEFIIPKGCDDDDEESDD